LKAAESAATLPEAAECFVQRSGETNFRVRNCRIIHLKSLDRLGVLVVFFFATVSVAAIQHGGIRMKNKLLNCLTAGVMAAALALAPPALARGGGGGHGGGGMGGGMHGGGGGMHGGGMHFGGMGGGMRAGGMGFAGSRVGFAGNRFGFAGSRFAGPRFAHAGFAHHGRFFPHRRFAFIGVPYAYASYDSCWRRTWTPYGLRWVNVCGGYAYY